MNTRIDLLFKIAYSAILVVWLFGYFSDGYSSTLLVNIASVAIFIFVVIAIYEIVAVNEVKPLEKLLWIFALILFSMLTCIVYYLMGWRKDILSEKYKG